MTTPAGDVLEIHTMADQYDPAFETFGLAVFGATPAVGTHARYRFAFNDDVLAYRIRAVGVLNGVFLAAMRTTNLPEQTGNPAVAFGLTFSSKGRPPPFRVREDAPLAAAAALNEGWMIGSAGAALPSDMWGFGVWADARVARPEFVNSTAAQQLPLSVMVDVIRAGI